MNAECQMLNVELMQAYYGVGNFFEKAFSIGKEIGSDLSYSEYQY